MRTVTQRAFLTLSLLLLPAFAMPAHGQVRENIVKMISDALPDKAPAKPQKARKLLIFSKTNGFRHGSIPIGVKAVTMMGDKTGAFTVFHTEDEGVFAPDKLKMFDAVLMLNTTGECFRPRKLPSDAAGKKAAQEKEEQLKKSLVDFVKSGKGLCGVHSATDTYKRWKDYNDMMGGAFAGHPWHAMVPIKNLAPKHPLNAAFDGKDFSVRDEIYQFRDGTALPTDRKFLLSLDGKKMDLSKGRRKDGLFPISWVSKYGKGRTFYCSLGHRGEIYYNPVVLKHYLAGFQYALGDLEVDATPSKSGN